jgi:hypothetical protein
VRGIAESIARYEPADPPINRQARPFHRLPAVPSWRPRRRPTAIRREVNL